MLPLRTSSDSFRRLAEDTVDQKEHVSIQVKEGVLWSLSGVIELKGANEKKVALPPGLEGLSSRRRDRGEGGSSFQIMW